jgi:uncharacterized membrane protein
LQKRPRANINKSKVEKLFDGITLLFTLSVILFLISKWSSIPESVAIHFNFAGEPDGWGSRWMIILPIIIGLILWIGLYFLEKYPQSYNYIGLTEENAQRQYKNGQLLIHTLKNVMLIFFSYLTIDSIRVSAGDKSYLGIWEAVLFLVVIFGTIGYFMYRSYRLR